VRRSPTRYHLPVRWLLNRYSYLIFSALALGGATVVGSRLGGPVGPAVVLGVGAALAAAQARLRSGSTLATWSAVQDAIRSGGPSLLFVYSDT
jgi:hypothetical protein